MKHYIAYSKSTGKVISTGSVPGDTPIEFADPDVGWIEGTLAIPEGDLGTYYIVNGRPSYAPADLEIIKAEKRREINNSWIGEYTKGSFLCSLGFKVQNRRSGITNDLQTLAELWQNMVDQGETNISFRDADNVMHPITRAQLLQILREMRAALRHRNTKKWTLLEEVDLASTEDDITAIKWKA